MDGTPTLTHIWMVTWNTINTARVREKTAILSALMHDVEEDMDFNVGGLIRDFFDRVYVYSKSHAGEPMDPSLHLQLTDFKKRFPGLSWDLVFLEPRIRGLYGPSGIMHNYDLTSILHKELSARVDHDFPQSETELLKADLEVLTKTIHESNFDYAKRIRRLGRPLIITVKLMDMAVNLTGPSASQPYKYVRDGLHLVVDEKEADSESYVLGRKHILQTLIQRIENSRKVLSMPLDSKRDKAEEANDLLVILEEFSGWTQRHPEIVRDIHNWTLFFFSLAGLQDEAERIAHPLDRSS
jgi:hypothetical protein